MDIHLKRAAFWKNFDPMSEAMRMIGIENADPAIYKLADKFAQKQIETLRVLREETMDSYYGCSASAMRECLKRNMSGGHLAKNPGKEIWGNSKKGWLVYFEFAETVSLATMYANWQGNPIHAGEYNGSIHDNVLSAYWDVQDGLAQTFIELEAYGEFIPQWQQMAMLGAHKADLIWAYDQLPVWAKRNLDS